MHGGGRELDDGLFILRDSLFAKLKTFDCSYWLVDEDLSASCSVWKNGACSFKRVSNYKLILQVRLASWTGKIVDLRLNLAEGWNWRDVVWTSRCHHVNFDFIVAFRQKIFRIFWKNLSNCLRALMGSNFSF